MFGFFNIDKPLGMTSHDVVARIRRVFKIKKVGHAGTLDPLASGVLVICVGSATRLSDDVMHGEKGYRARVKFGVTTTTYDREGEITAQNPVDHLTAEAVMDALRGFVGEIDQVPPMYSAIKHGGKKLYDLARSGVEVERAPRRVTIDELTLREWISPEAVIDVRCSAGTYIRSLAFDLGEALGVGAHLSGLIRTRSGAFSLTNAVALDTLLDADPRDYLITPRDAFPDVPSITLSDFQVQEIQHGRAIPVPEQADSARVMGYNHVNTLIAILDVRHGMAYPSRVFNSAVED